MLFIFVSLLLRLDLLHCYEDRNEIFDESIMESKPHDNILNVHAFLKDVQYQRNGENSQENIDKNGNPFAGQDYDVTGIWWNATDVVPTNTINPFTTFLPGYGSLFTESSPAPEEPPTSIPTPPPSLPTLMFPSHHDLDYMGVSEGTPPLTAITYYPTETVSFNRPKTVPYSSNPLERVSIKPETITYMIPTKATTTNSMTALTIYHVWMQIIILPNIFPSKAQAWVRERMLKAKSPVVHRQRVEEEDITEPPRAPDLDILTGNTKQGNFFMKNAEGFLHVGTTPAFDEETQTINLQNRPHHVPVGFSPTMPTLVGDVLNGKSKHPRFRTYWSNSTEIEEKQSRVRKGQKMSSSTHYIIKSRQQSSRTFQSVNTDWNVLLTLANANVSKITKRPKLMTKRFKQPIIKTIKPTIASTAEFSSKRPMRANYRERPINVREKQIYNDFNPCTSFYRSDRNSKHRSHRFKIDSVTIKKRTTPHLHRIEERLKKYQVHRRMKFKSELLKKIVESSSYSDEENALKVNLLGALTGIRA